MAIVPDITWELGTELPPFENKILKGWKKGDRVCSSLRPKG